MVAIGATVVGMGIGICGAYGKLYGGPVANRVRLTAEVVEAIRAEVGPDWCVGVRLSQTKVNDFHHRWPGGVHDGEVIFAALADAGATYLHIASEGRNWIETAELEGGLTITTYAAALQAGGVGDLIKVRNPESGIVVTGTVQPDGSVRVSDS